MTLRICRKDRMRLSSVKKYQPLPDGYISPAYSIRYYLVRSFHIFTKTFPNRYSKSPGNKVYGLISEAKSRATLMRAKTKRRSQL